MYRCRAVAQLCRCSEATPSTSDGLTLAPKIMFEAGSSAPRAERDPVHFLRFPVLIYQVSLTLWTSAGWYHGRR